MKSQAFPLICITLGDPAGIGPEVAVKAMLDETLRCAARWILVGERWQIDELGKLLRFTPDQVIRHLAEARAEPGAIVLDARQLSPQQVTMGQVSADCGRAGLEYVRWSTEYCLAGQAQALVTGPLCKQAVAMNGVHFTGHTEFIADKCQAAESRILLYNERLCAVHVSSHISLAQAAHLNVDRIYQTIRLGHEAMIRFRGRPARIAVCGLNPHAGENGLFGDEDAKFIVPAVERAQSEDMDCAGPFPADTLFMQAAGGKYDLVVAMYHDQGHVPMKLLDFEHTVNVTLGLPIVRTSVDHGTAFDIAGTNSASCEDMRAAMRLALRLVGHSHLEL